ncbi:helicase/secretion neighborhood ATPase [Aeromicrobium marinum DSM 15272]|uniref:Helicase/secretion neighborhood ATPase n=1 Tax=Aeromicrobium marinum DSM 15272 TaxID=585531 RepID=E2SFI1_9ACTN|nr:TadA family conjugal transfer-associated ATPase [Aeromicrobium marinum]EFQ82082.1 helicase/secretion neighborhood ATPase [Aeromicrobium marinum DSM 15272]
MTDVPVDLLERVRRRLAVGVDEPTAGHVADALRAETHMCGSDTVLAILDRLRRESRGIGALEPLVSLPGVTDVLVNGAEAVHLDRGHGLELTDVSFGSDAEVRRLAQRLAAQAGRRLDDASPWVDARLPDGTRFHAVLAPVARPGTVISLRVPSRRTFSLAELVAAGAVGPAGATVLRQLVAARLSFVVSGGTGSGKTTVLSALLGEVPAAERIVVVEDATELRPDHPHVVGLEARPANVEGAGVVTVRDLVRQALRMRPDRLVVGEVRGAEVVDLLAALNTGHEGGCGTVHANSAADVPARFEALGVAGGLPRDAVHSQVAAGLDAVLHLGRAADGRRRIEHLAAVVVDPSGRVSAVPAIVMAGGAARPGPAHDALAARLERGR